MINVQPKYHFTGKIKTIFLTDKFGERRTVKLYQIQALRSFGTVREGDIGGYVARGSRDERGREPNLDHRGNCWIGDNAMAYSHAVIKGDAILCGAATARGRAVITDSAVVQDQAIINGYSLIWHNAVIGGQSLIGGVANILGRSRIFCTAKPDQSHLHISDLVTVRDQACVEGNPRIRGRVVLCDNVVISGTARLSGNVLISRNARVENSAKLEDDVWVTDHAHVCSTAWMRGRSVAYGRSIIGQQAYITDNVHINGANISKERISGYEYRTK